MAIMSVAVVVVSLVSATRIRFVAAIVVMTAAPLVLVLLLLYRNRGRWPVPLLPALLPALAGGVRIERPLVAMEGGILLPLMIVVAHRIRVCMVSVRLLMAIFVVEIRLSRI